jgi:hypothetical protein
MHTIRNAFAGLAFAAVAGVAAGPAGAQPRLEQAGDGYSVVYDGVTERGGVAGGRAARLQGGGDDSAIVYFGPDPALEGRFATLSGGGDDAVLTHAEPSSAARVAGGATAPGAAAARRDGS